MTAIQVLNNTKTMSSLEIATLTGKRHDNVVSDIKRILEEAEIEATGFQGALKMPSGQIANVYNLPRRECDLIISAYDVKYRLAIIDRWHELEQKEKDRATRFAIDLSNQVTELLMNVKPDTKSTDAQRLHRILNKPIEVRPLPKAPLFDLVCEPMYLSVEESSKLSKVSVNNIKRILHDKLFTCCNGYPLPSAKGLYVEIGEYNEMPLWNFEFIVKLVIHFGWSGLLSPKIINEFG